MALPGELRTSVAVLKAKMRLSADTVDRLQAQWKHLVGNGLPLIVLDDGMDLEILTGPVRS